MGGGGGGEGEVFHFFHTKSGPGVCQHHKKKRKKNRVSGPVISNKRGKLLKEKKIEVIFIHVYTVYIYIYI